jgi:hypothetical protein
MQQINANQIRELAADIAMELERLSRLEEQIQHVTVEIQHDLTRADIFYESLALKLHNFYTGCERIFRLVAMELNGGMPSGQDLHRRLLDRMSSERDGRPVVIRSETARRLQDYLGFRQVVRNVYGFELDPERVARLVEMYPSAWCQVEQEISAFVQWLGEIAHSLNASE